MDILSNFTVVDYILVALAIIMIILAVVFRESKYVIKIVGEAIVEAEKKLNSESGQKRLEYAVERIEEQLPYLLKPFMTKRILVSIIEFMLNFMNDAFKTGKTAFGTKAERCSGQRSSDGLTVVTYENFKEFFITVLNGLTRIGFDYIIWLYNNMLLLIIYGKGEEAYV